MWTSNQRYLDRLGSLWSSGSQAAGFRPNTAMLLAKVASGNLAESQVTEGRAVRVYQDRPTSCVTRPPNSFTFDE